MIVASEERFIPVNPGYITLQDTVGAYYYVHRSLYEQAVIIEDRYSRQIETLQKLIGGNSDFEAIGIFVRNTPRPINIMGYFLALLDEDITEYTDIIGAFDVISSALNLRNLIKQPSAIRQEVHFSMSVENEYKDGWDVFFQQCYNYDDIKSRTTGSTYNATPAITEEEIETDAASEWEKAMAEFDQGIASIPDDPIKEESKEDSAGMSVIQQEKRKRRKL